MEVFSFSLLCLGNSFSPSILTESLVGQSSLGCRPLLYNTWNIYWHCLLAGSVSVEKSAAILIGASLYATSCFSLDVFKSLSLSWNFAILITMCLDVDLFGFPLCFFVCLFVCFFEFLCCHFFIFQFLLLYYCSITVFCILPPPLPHPSQTHLPPLLPPSPLVFPCDLIFNWNIFSKRKQQIKYNQRG